MKEIMLIIVGCCIGIVVEYIWLLARGRVKK